MKAGNSRERGQGVQSLWKAGKKMRCVHRTTSIRLSLAFSLLTSQNYIDVIEGVEAIPLPLDSELTLVFAGTTKP